MGSIVGGLGLALSLLFLVWASLKVGTGRQMKYVLVAAGCGLAGAAGWYFLPEEFPDLSTPPSTADSSGDSAEKQRPVSALPQVNRADGYVSSDACLKCHPDQHASWHETFHRTMTQDATPEAVIPDWDNVTLTSHGRTYRLFRKGEEFWTNTVDPTAEIQAFLAGIELGEVSDIPMVDRRIVMTTGSHLHQTYWMSTAAGTLVQFPWVYHINTGRWVFRTDSFLRPPRDKVTFNIWNLSCIACHATGPNPNVDPHRHTMRSLGEMGIACEACHGPGGKHVRIYESAGTGPAPAETAIANPRKMSAADSAKVCGQCHVISDRRDEESFLAHGDPYRPGDGGFDTLRKVVEIAGDDDSVIYGRELIHTRFWPDGTVRTGGREYNGLIRTRCFLHEDESRRLRCTSCHSMHRFQSPNKLMSAELSGNALCTQCHLQDKYNSRLEEHTHHRLDSTGSRCVECHMPRTSYALFNAIRSHRIQSPAVRGEAHGARPNACNLCHVDRTFNWASDRLSEWYNVNSTIQSEAPAEVAAGMIWALKGDAAQRAVFAWNARSSVVRQASNDRWIPAILTELLQDPYAAVRYIAYESLKTYDGFESFEFVFDAPVEERERARRRAEEIWRSLPKYSDVRGYPAGIPRSPRGELDRNVIESLIKLRDNRPITILE